MKNRGVGRTVAGNRRSFSFSFFSAHSPRRLRSLRSTDLFQEFESRVLLSASPLATPDFKLYQSAGSGLSPNSSTGVIGLTPTAIRQAYGINQVLFGAIAGTGAGQTIAIVDAYDDPNIAADLHAFDVQFGLADPTFTKIGQTGSTTVLPGAAAKNSWGLEIALDVEWAHAIAPGANILLVEANSNSYSDLLTAVDTARRYAGVSVVSMSWGGGEFSGETSIDSYFTTTAGHQGVTFLASSGDGGAGVENPAASPNVVAVGGTTLTLSGGNYSSESAWSGAGGGLSAYESQPTYQHGIVTQSTTQRGVPDVAFDANPSSGVAVYDSYDASTAPWFQVGGTSLSAPAWAGIIAIADQGRVLSGQGTLDGATGTLPKLYALPSSDFHDITTGSNGYAAGVGYDLVTGRGTPIANLLIPDLVGVTTPVPAIGSFAISPSAVVSGTTVTLTASNVQEINGAGTISTVNFYRETNGSSGLQIGSDTLIGTGTQNGTTWTITASTASFAARNYTYYAVATDSANVSSSPSVAALTVVSPTIGSFTVSPTSVSAGATVTLTASNVQETSGSVSTVKFYRESNGSSGLQSGSDTLVGTGTQNGTTWTLAFSTTGMAAGNYTYYAVATDAVNINSATSSAVLSIVVQAPVNDMFASATVISGTSLTVTGTNVGATKQSGEPSIAGNRGGKSVWWVWTATSSGQVSLDTHGSSFDTLLGVFTGTSVNKLKSIASNNNDPAGGTLTSDLKFNAIAGTTYRIAVDGYNGAAGSIVLNLSAPAPAIIVNAPTTLMGWHGWFTSGWSVFG